jgi:hypothetical protein
MDERSFMDIIRRALMMIVRAIEKRYSLGGYTVKIQDNDNLT